MFDDTASFAAQEVAGKIKRKVEKRIMDAMWKAACTSYASPSIYVRPSSLAGHSILIASDADRIGAKVKVEVADDMATKDLHALADDVGRTLGRIVRRMDKDDFGDRKLIQDGDNWYVERRDGTCRGLSASDGKRLKGSSRPFDLPDDDGDLKKGPYPTAYHVPHLCIDLKEEARRKETARLTQAARVEEQERELRRIEAAKQKVAREKEEFYEKSGYGMF